MSAEKGAGVTPEQGNILLCGSGNGGLELSSTVTSEEAQEREAWV